jgi:zinc protease
MRLSLTILFLAYTINSISQKQSSFYFREDSLKASGIISKYIHAVLGSSNLSTNLSGKSQGMDTEMRILKKFPNRFSVESFLNGKTVSKQIGNGSQFIMLVQNYSVPVDQATKDIGIFEWSLLPETRIQELNIKPIYKGAVIENNISYELIEYHFPSGHKFLNYFDAKTGLKMKTVREQMSAVGNITMVSKFADYREVQGFKFPYEIIQSMGGIEQKMSLTLIEINIELEDSLFKTENSN